MESLCFVTSNHNKLLELSKYLECPLEQVHIKLNEIQTSNLEELVAHKLKQAWDLLQKPLFVEDTSLYFEAWNGMPGPLVKWFLEHLGPKGMVKTLEGFSNHQAQAICCLGFTSNGKKHHFFQGETEGKIVAPRGAFNFGWDPIFQPDEASMTFGEMSKTQKESYSMRSRAAKKFMNFLVETGWQK